MFVRTAQAVHCNKPHIVMKNLQEEQGGSPILRNKTMESGGILKGIRYFEHKWEKCSEIHRDDTVTVRAIVARERTHGTVSSR